MVECKSRFHNSIDNRSDSLEGSNTAGIAIWARWLEPNMTWAKRCAPLWTFWIAPHRLSWKTIQPNLHPGTRSKQKIVTWRAITSKIQWSTRDMMELTLLSESARRYDRYRVPHHGCNICHGMKYFATTSKRHITVYLVGNNRYTVLLRQFNDLS